MGIVRATLVLLCFGGAARADCQSNTLEIRTPAGSLSRFHVEVADDDAERARGLMFRETMPTAAGMLFVYPRPGRVAFWMENTLIPLDMIFVDATGTVMRVHENAVPRDRTAIPGGTNIQFVLEINGGLARRMGLTEGAVVRHPAIDQSRASFPCEAE
jgi:uncharacterized protein